MKSWKTTLFGVGTVISAVGSVLTALLDGNSATNPDWTVVFAAITSGIGLIFARDNDKSSEAVGAK